MKNIGETFGDELRAAGCNDGVSFTIGGTDADIQVNSGPYSVGLLPALDAVIAAHDPTKQESVVDPVAELANQIKADPNGLAAIKQVLGF